MEAPGEGSCARSGAVKVARGRGPPVIMRAMSLIPSAWGGRPLWAEIDLDALTHNVRLLAARAAPSRICAVVKANAYGHGAVACGRAALGGRRGPRGRLRRRGGGAPRSRHRRARPGRRLHVPYRRGAGGRAAAPAGRGLARVRRGARGGGAPRGRTVPRPPRARVRPEPPRAPPDALVALAERARAMPGVEVEGLFTHFAAAEEGDQRFTRRQFDVLREVSARLPFVDPSATAPPRRASCSTRRWRSRRCAPGLSMYGYRPAPGAAPTRTFDPCSRCGAASRASRRRAGRHGGLRPDVGGGRAARIALVMCGYADGYRRGSATAPTCSCAAAARRWSAASRWTCAWWTSPRSPGSPPGTSRRCSAATARSGWTPTSSPRSPTPSPGSSSRASPRASRGSTCATARIQAISTLTHRTPAPRL